MYLFFILLHILINGIVAINLTEYTILGTTTTTTETLYGSFPCNGNLLKEVIRDDVFHTRTPCTGFTFLIGNDSYDITLSNDMTDRIDLIGPQTYNAYLNGYQLFTQFGAIDHGICRGGLFITVQLLYPLNYKACVTNVGLDRAQSYYTYMKIHGGKCHADCQGYIGIDFKPPLQGYPV